MTEQTNRTRLKPLIIMAVLVLGTLPVFAAGNISVRLDMPRGSSDLIRFQGDPVPLTVTVDRECFVTVVALNARGDIRVLFPNEQDYCNRLLPGTHPIEFRRGLMASAPGPALIYAFAGVNKRYRYHFTDYPVPFLDRGPFDRTREDRLFPTEPERHFPISIHYAMPRPVRNISRWEADDLADELQDRMDDDYYDFSRTADDFLSWVQSRTYGLNPRTYGSDYLDVYVAPWRFSPDSYRVTGYGYHRPGEWDPFTTYGEWIDIGRMRVWLPRVWSGWVPFSNGYWTWTRSGWTWISYEPWGDITDHYGYWAWHRRYGWIWIPGDEWAPAPVAWYVSNTFYAWFPRTPPRSIRSRLGRDCRFGDNLPAYSRVAKRDFLNRDLSKVLKSPEKIQAFSKRGNSFKLMRSGPSRDEIVRATGKKVRKTKLVTGKTLTVKNRKLVPYTDRSKPQPSPELTRKLKSHAPLKHQEKPGRHTPKPRVRKKKPKDGKLYKIPVPDLKHLLNPAPGK